MRSKDKAPSAPTPPGADPTATRPAGRPTLKTIAYMTGLGVTTVSRALHDAPDIGQATKERVRLVAARIGYRPNRAGVRLRTGKTNVISLVLSLESEVLGFTSDLVFGISEYLSGSPYHLIVTPYNLDSDPLDPVRYIVETGSADGVILSRIEPMDARVRFLHERRIPFATHGRTRMGIEHPFVDFDNERYGEIAVDRLVARGRRRLALLPPPWHLSFARHMAAGFQKGVERHDVVDVPIRGVTTDSDHAAIRAEVGRIMAARRRPDGIVCGSAMAAISAIGAAEDAGLIIGRDFDVVVKEHVDLMHRFRNEIQVVHENVREAGLGLAEAVVRTIDGETAADLQTLIVPDGWVENETSPAPLRLSP